MTGPFATVVDPALLGQCTRELVLTASNSLYEFVPALGLARRVTGDGAPVPRIGEDGVWNQAQALSVVVEGDCVLIDWTGVNLSLTNVVVAVETIQPADPIDVYLLSQPMHLRRQLGHVYAMRYASWVPSLAGHLLNPPTPPDVVEELYAEFDWIVAVSTAPTPQEINERNTQMRILRNAHSRLECSNRSFGCWLHAPSRHSFDQQSAVVHAQSFAVYRVCKHGVATRDPDDRAFRDSLKSAPPEPGGEVSCLLCGRRRAQVPALTAP